jgi:hypothetical protein
MDELAIVEAERCENVCTPKLPTLHSLVLSLAATSILSFLY